MNQFAQHFTMILTLIFSNGQVQVQTVPNFASYASCTLAGETSNSSRQGIRQRR
jgi:hypothetical protein